MRILVCLGRSKHGEWSKNYPDNLRSDPVIQAWQRYQVRHPELEIIGYDNVSKIPTYDVDIVVQYENHKHVYNPATTTESHNFKNAYKVFYVQDTVRYPDIHKHLSKYFDLVFCSQRNAYEVLKSHPNLDFYPMGIDPYKIFRIDNFPKFYDLGIISGMKDYTYRTSYLNHVKDIAKGQFWTGINRNDLGYYYNLCKIGVNLSTRGTWDMIAYRTLEVMGSGSLLITNRLNKGVMEELYDENIHYVAFDDGNYDEFREKVKYYLENEEARLKIANAGYKLVHDKYTWDHQVDHLVKGAVRGYETQHKSATGLNK